MIKNPVEIKIKCIDCGKYFYSVYPKGDEEQKCWAEAVDTCPKCWFGIEPTDREKGIFKKPSRKRCKKIAKIIREKH